MRRHVRPASSLRKIKPASPLAQQVLPSTSRQRTGGAIAFHAPDGRVWAHTGPDPNAAMQTQSPQSILVAVVTLSCIVRARLPATVGYSPRRFKQPRAIVAGGGCVTIRAQPMAGKSMGVTG